VEGENEMEEADDAEKGANTTTPFQKYVYVRTTPYRSRFGGGERMAPGTMTKQEKFGRVQVGDEVGWHSKSIGTNTSNSTSTRR